MAKSEVDKVGIEQMGVDKVRIDIVGGDLESLIHINYSKTAFIRRGMCTQEATLRHLTNGDRQVHDRRIF